jgi:hypothetical protein
MDLGIAIAFVALLLQAYDRLERELDKHRKGRRMAASRKKRAI